MNIINSEEKIHPHFKLKEFLSKDPSLKSGHGLSDTVIKAILWLRDFYDVPITINSTARSTAYNALIGGTKDSYHIKERAIDFTVNNSKAQQSLKNDLLNQGAVFNHLRQMGINGFGIYDTFFHFDDRDKYTRSKDKYGNFQIWEGNKVLEIVVKAFPVLLVILIGIGFLISLK